MSGFAASQAQHFDCMCIGVASRMSALMVARLKHCRSRQLSSAVQGCDSTTGHVSLHGLIAGKVVHAKRCTNNATADPAGLTIL